ncbi:MAG TPA: hypothetical protein VIX91_24490, partial [Candidatus Acidoferrum sp.]
QGLNMRFKDVIETGPGVAHGIWGAGKRLRFSMAYGPETGSQEVKIEVRDCVRWSELETQRGGQGK